MFATGVTVITTREGDQVHGMTANAFMSVSLEPPLVLISVDRRTKMCALLHEGRNYGVSVLCETQSALSDRFAGRVGENAPEPRFDVIHDTPLVEGALAHFVANINRSYWGGDHSLFLGRVEYARYNERPRRCCSTAAATSASARPDTAPSVGCRAMLIAAITGLQRLASSSTSPRSWWASARPSRRRSRSRSRRSSNAEHLPYVHRLQLRSTTRSRRPR